jgi:hypothetical protein
MLALFALSACGQTVTGFRVHNHELVAEHQPALSLGAYLTSGAFAEAVFENWESEFLQMAVFVLLTKYLRQRGSSESKPMTGSADVDEEPRLRRDAPGPVKRGGIGLRLYQHSLTLALLALFALSFAGHAMGGASAYSAEQKLQGAPGVSTLEYLGTSQFWFESFQNWQSEFLSMAVLIYLSIYLRERGSPQSKPVAAPHAQTGD